MKIKLMMIHPMIDQISLTTSDGLNTNDIRDVVVDKRGDVWVATSLGVNIITNTSGVPTSGSSGLRYLEGVCFTSAVG